MGGRCACSAHAIRLSFGFILIRVSVVRGRSLYSVLNYIHVTILSSIQFYDTSFLQHYNNTNEPLGTIYGGDSSGRSNRCITFIVYKTRCLIFASTVYVSSSTKFRSLIVPYFTALLT